MDVQRKGPEMTISKEVATISLNSDGKINIALEKADFLEAVNEIFRDPKAPFTCPKLLLCLHPKFKLDPRDIFGLYEKGILADKDLTAEQIQVFKSIRG